MHNKFLMLLFLFTGIHCFAQPCDPRELAVRPGKWKGPGLGSTSAIPTAIVQKEKALLAQLHNRFKEFYKPVGLVASYSYAVGFSNGRSYNLEGSKNWPALPYRYSCYFLEYWCDPNTGKERVNGEGETGTFLKIYINDMRPIVPIEPHEMYDKEDITQPGWTVLYAQPEKLADGYYRFDLLPHDRHSFYPNDSYEAWLITYDDKLPYMPVPRKEYLLWLQKKLKEKVKENETMRNYYSPSLDNIARYLSENDEETLSQPAYINDGELNNTFTTFKKEGEGIFIVKPNLDYYNRKLSQSAPQFFVVETRCRRLEDEVYRNGITDARKAIDINMMKRLLRKEVNGVPAGR
ncbi:MAG: hypothetical protein LC128_15390 [Chitinophagales bacterium]|nr:hypothetical protein [Chitinophagales bacterium]